MDRVSKEVRSSIMSKVRSKDTKIELALRKILSENKLRYRNNSPKYYGRPDVVMASKKIVIFVDSCFWHGCRWHGKMPSSNKRYWKAKISRNKYRDKLVNKWYKNSGWKIARIWEHQFKEDATNIFSKINKLL